MRVKTAKRRSELLVHAAAVFGERGYDSASMEEIAIRAGASKATLYRYFDTKESLFATVMMDEMAHRAARVAAMLDPSTGDPRSALMAFARAYLDVVLAPHSLAIARIVMAQRSGSLGADLYAMGPRQGWESVAEHLRAWVDHGLLRPAPSGMMALHLRGLLEAGLVEPLLFGAPAAVERDEGAALAVEAFLRAYRAA